MEAIIMAAGVGSRLGSTAEGMPKSYLELGGERLLARNIRLLREVGVSRIIIVVGYRHEEFERDFVAGDVEFLYNPFYRTANVLSSYWIGCGALTDDFFYLHADTIFDPRVLEGLAKAEGDLLLACDRKKCEEEEMKYTTKDGNILALNKTMNPEDAEGEFLGLCRIGKQWLPSLQTIAGRLLGNGEYNAFFEMSLQDLIDNESAAVKVYDVGELPWVEIDFPEDFAAAEAAFNVT